jgi:hypothetical protein
MDAKPKRRWFRFSLRRLVILTTAVALYSACWWPTKTTGVVDFIAQYGPRYRSNVYAAAPLVLGELHVTFRKSSAACRSSTSGGITFGCLAVWWNCRLRGKV